MAHHQTGPVRKSRNGQRARERRKRRTFSDITPDARPRMDGPCRIDDRPLGIVSFVWPTGGAPDLSRIQSALQGCCSCCYGSPPVRDTIDSRQQFSSVVSCGETRERSAFCWLTTDYSRPAEQCPSYIVRSNSAPVVFSFDAALSSDAPLVLGVRMEIAGCKYPSRGWPITVLSFLSVRPVGPHSSPSSAPTGSASSRLTARLLHTMRKPQMDAAGMMLRLI